ncbi:tail fiber protein [Xanthomonas phage pXoo2106]|uniref:Tail fiber protein n=1 Tax=Xanthomonas phage pXoo2106 TaxID=2970483 RepID=A0AAX3C0W9_9CAUD|nr:tail fiber protein [Xanthomonas phage pXoo2106]
MANHLSLYNKPLESEDDLTLSVTGVLAEYVVGAAYESALSVNNPKGRFRVEVLSSDLPPGTAVLADNINKRVVVKWPAYLEVSENETLVPNGDFESGNDGRWSPGAAASGAGWSIGTGSDYDTDSGVYSARFADVNTRGSDLVNVKVPARVNDYVRCTAQVQQGASSKGKAGARVSIVFSDADGEALQRNSGNMVSSGSNGNWGQSVAEGGAPMNTAFVQVVLSAFRSKQNKPLWVDNVRWTHKYYLGTDNEAIYFLSIKVTDSENRVAYFSEPITKSNVIPWQITEFPGILDYFSVASSASVIEEGGLVSMGGLLGWTTLGFSNAQWAPWQVQQGGPGGKPYISAVVGEWGYRTTNSVPQDKPGLTFATVARLSSSAVDSSLVRMNFEADSGSSTRSSAMIGAGYYGDTVYYAGGRRQVNDSFAATNSITNSEWAIVVAQFDYVLGVITLTVNGVVYSQANFQGTGSPQGNTVALGWDGVVSGASAPHSFTGLVVAAGPVDSDSRQKLEGWLAHQHGLAGLLPVDHPYRTTVPTTQGT